MCPVLLPHTLNINRGRYAVIYICQVALHYTVLDSPILEFICVTYSVSTRFGREYD